MIHKCAWVRDSILENVDRRIVVFVFDFSKDISKSERRYLKMEDKINADWLLDNFFRWARP